MKTLNLLFLRMMYLVIGTILGMMLVMTTITVVVSKRSEKVTRLTKENEKLKQMIARDDKIIKHVLGDWDRDKPIYVRSAFDKQGGIITYYSQELEHDLWKLPKNK